MNTDAPRSNRREFITGRAISKAIGKSADPSLLPRPDFPGTAPGEQPAGDAMDDKSVGTESNFLETFSKPAMACQFEFLFNMRQNRRSGAAAEDAFVLIDELEDQMTIYRNDSEIIQINQAAFQRPIKVEDQLFGLLQTAIEIHRSTAGAFDVTAGELSKLWGFEQRKGSIPNPDAIQETVKNVGSQHLLLDDRRRTVSFSMDGLKINLGGIGKGYAIDRVASLFHINGIHDFAIHGGQSSVRCGGQYGSRSAQRHPTDPHPTDPHPTAPHPTAITGWPIGLSHPILSEVRLAYFYLNDQALGTSGSGRQGFFHQGKRYGHIIDPRTGWPTDHFLSTTVISNSAALSDALATAFFVMSIEEIEAYCKSNLDVSVVITTGAPNAGQGQVELIWFNLDDQQWSRC